MKKKNKNKIKNTIVSLIVSLIVLIELIAFVILPKDEISYYENRYLANIVKFNFSNLISGKYANSIEDFIKDHFAFRSDFLQIKSITEIVLRKKENNQVILGDNGYLFHKYLGNYEENVKYLNKFISLNRNLNVKLLLIPTSSAIYPEYIDKRYKTTEIEDLEEIQNKLEIKTINLYKAFSENKSQNLYFRLDHHITIHGAYLAYLEYCKCLGIEPYSIDDFSAEIVSTEFYGYYYSKFNLYTLKPDSLEIIRPKFNVNYTKETDSYSVNDLYDFTQLTGRDKYGIYPASLEGLTILKNNNLNDYSKLLVVKDSNANDILPYLVNHYQQIDVIDLTYYNKKISEYIKENNIKDVLFIYSIQSFNGNYGIGKVR